MSSGLLQQPGKRRNPMHVLVVDDSAVMRQVLAKMLAREQDIEVSVAADPLIAMEKMKRKRPDVILLDVEMPRMDGLTFLRKIMSEDPIPVVICSGVAGRGTQAALRALEEGAVEIVTKPKLGVREFLEESAAMLIETLRGAAQARVRPRSPAHARLKDAVTAPLPPRTGSLAGIADGKIVALGASTGGTEALRSLLETMPTDAPGIVIVQHMPEAFTAAFARRLNETCRLQVKEATNGDRILRGTALVAPGNRHMLVRRASSGYMVEVTKGPLVSGHRPSVDVLFASIAQTAGSNAIGVIMTGMGNDGAAGLLQMKQAGASTIAQDEASCVVFGMPREAITRGAVCEVASLSKLPYVILKRLNPSSTGPLS